LSSSLAKQAHAIHDEHGMPAMIRPLLLLLLLMMMMMMIMMMSSAYVATVACP
jgi:hypothetical protein